MSAVMIWLGSLGLIPFLGLSLLLLFSPEQSQALFALEMYSFGIVSYLAGTWWLKSPQGPDWLSAVFGHGVFLLAFFVLVMLPQLFLGVAAVLLAVMYATERYSQLLGTFSPKYLTLRRNLTLVASICLLAVQVRLL